MSSSTHPLDPESCQRLVSHRRWATKVRVASNQCWEWIGALTENGYGIVWLDGGMRRAHRVAYVAAVGADIPADLVLDHTCRRRYCVNAEHLRAVTRRENTFADGSLAPSLALAMRTHCPAGHPLREGNLRAAQWARGHRGCLTCARIRGRQQSAAVSAAAAALGMRWTDYVTAHGTSLATAAQMLRDLGADPDEVAR